MKRKISFNYHYDLNVVRQYQVHIEYVLVFEMILLESDMREVTKEN
jgi:hypothetical protein